ncbi:tRNA (adenosine(37)-N6)-threonylcarbamoyltransferase complex transferase subunit TsaD [Pikeienuella piscinae]|uniref:tRNA N6-adenosine threonylcarbamoyltransferase n=1 Tax=Pikeienuella piscinae TaxID=2748098 RepID=A0A7L5BYV9_9RHOB|nr:tRNA (adenosine(37)-N6)-threonylcarbamoyltransferase complex transferase subunit TsaD [Pikeienuella piscinae]QIE55074.1 tRNA (adenosine(37)-N6)-threonylcarbamoyltransferase complex transferase subunit TsaD [Pikeienuella piscinae]
MEEITVLGIESSCDDTAAALVRVRIGSGGARGPGEILSSVVIGQEGLHAGFGGVVPEIAARAHAERLDLAVEAALAEAGCGLGGVDLVGVTAGPGLIGGVLSGVMCAKGIAFGAGLPLIGVNHLEGHALTPRLTDGIGAPYLLLLVSGGHCQLIEVAAPCRYKRLGGSIDDAPGEAFDKIAKLLGLGYPGGPEVEREALSGDETRFAFPRPLIERTGFDMSFSGLKTAVLRARDDLVAVAGGITVADRADLCASFQAAARDLLAAKTRAAMVNLASGGAHPVGARRLAVAGGVAANRAIRGALEAAAAETGFSFHAPPLALCTDNGAMIAWAAAERWALGERGGEITARPRWPLDESAPPMLGGGRKGPRV